MKASQTTAKSRYLKPIELVAIGLFFIGLRIVSGQLSSMLLEQMATHPASLVTHEQGVSSGMNIKPL